jgi:hypothetical protein
MAQNTVRHSQSRSSETNRAPSPAVWGNCPLASLLADPGRGLVFFDDFQDLPVTPSDLTTTIAFGKYKAYAATGCTISRVTSINSVETQGGAVQIAMDTDNDEAAFGQVQGSFYLSGDPTTSGKLWLEICYAQNSIATDLAATFIGLGEVDAFTFGANVPMNSGDAISNSGSMIGFRIEEDGTGVIDTVYSDRATSFTNINDDVDIDLAANTFKKLGMVYDPNETEKCVRFFIDNVEDSTYLSRSALTALTNLDANPLGLMWAVAADSGGTSFKSYVKWWRVAQLFPNEP